MKLGLHISNFTWDGGPAAAGADLTQMADDGRGRRLRQPHRDGPLLADPRRRPARERHARGLHGARLPGRGTNRCSCSRWSPASPTAPPACWPRRSPRSTCSRVDGRRSASARPGTRRRRSGSASGYAPTAIRFEMLEEALQICLQMWSDDDGPYEGKHYQLGSTLNSPQPLQRPRPRIMIGGGGEKKTLRLVAQYADACNIFGGPEAAHEARRPARALRRARPRLRRDREDLDHRLDHGRTRRRTSAPTLESCAGCTSSASPRCTARCAATTRSPARDHRPRHHPGRLGLVARIVASRLSGPLNRP